MELSRKPTKQEKRLLEILIEKASIEFRKSWSNGLLVCPMDDGKMGSLYLLPQGKDVKGRVFGEQVSDIQFVDLDGVEVIASLNLDDDGDLFELDIWKTNFGQLLKFPDL